MKYKNMPKNKGTDITLQIVADLNRKCNISIKPLVRPQPKQDIPNRFFIGHTDTENSLVIMYKIKKKTHPTPKERKVRFFPYGRLLYLCQRLTITVSEAAR